MGNVVGNAFFLDNQAYVKTKYKPNANHLLFYLNFYSLLICFLIEIARDTLKDDLAFCINHPTVIFDLFVVSFLQAVGQIAVCYIVVNFKQHVFPLIRMTRQIVTIILSIIIFNHSITLHQVGCIVLLFGSLFYEFVDEFYFSKKLSADQKEKIPEIEKVVKPKSM